MARTVRRTHAAASGVRRTAHAAGVERGSTPLFIVAEGATPSGRGVLHSGVRCTLRLRSSCTAWRAFQTEGCMHRGIPVTKPRSGPVPPRCMQYRMRRAVCDAHVASARVAHFVGARCALHRRALHRRN
jgi:hypothetical protein